MPTGYTAKLMEEGQTFQEYAMTCARAFGACIEMRDDPMDKPIPEEFKPSDYYLVSVKKMVKELNDFKKMTKDEIETWYKKIKNSTIKDIKNSLKKIREEDSRLDKMWTEVLNWNPPTEEHKKFKDFMLEQIRISYNSSTDWYKKELKRINKITAEEMYNEHIESLVGRIANYKEHYNKECEAVKSRNAWIKNLRDSLKNV